MSRGSRLGSFSRRISGCGCSSPRRWRSWPPSGRRPGGRSPGCTWCRCGMSPGPGRTRRGLEDEYRLAAGKPMLLYLKRPAPGEEPRLAAMIEDIRAAGTVSYRTFATPRELERLLADDLAVLLSESFAGAAVMSVEAPPAEQGEPGPGLPAGTVTFLLTDI